MLIQYLVESISHTLFAKCLIGDFTLITQNHKKKNECVNTVCLCCAWCKEKKLTMR